ncbi:hypothetical protein E6H29_10065 [Candidatus Bathyarchaeota archaeon]|nr:MAG: hypothetical protein E6H29_10065 [Candidatus Bathyarchaeota archaeon]
MTTQLSVTKFFQSVEERAWTDAEKELDVIRQKAENNQWSRGYIKALEGLMLTYKSNDDKHLYLPKALSNRSDESTQRLHKEFGEFSSDELHGEYDRGYFKALEEYLAVLKTQKGAHQIQQQSLQKTLTGDDSEAAGN